jgi:8-oxo-dGTP pyrophosphatase MutT (NUDIX family)
MPVPAQMRPPAVGVGRASAILILLGEGTAGPDVLLVQRGPALRRHAGQPAFPGGAIEAADAGPVGAALREAAEEALVEPAGVQVLAVLPDLYIPRSGFRVSPVLAWWREPSPVAPGDPAEIAGVARVPLAELAEPERRRMYRYPAGGRGPAFLAAGMVVWGFTGYLLDRLLHLGGWERPWDHGNVADLPAGLLPDPGPAASLSGPAALPPDTVRHCAR